MKLRDEFVTQESDGEQIMVATGNMKFSGLVRSNETAAFIVDCLKFETTMENIVEKMFIKYDVDKTILFKDVEKIIEDLRNIGAIDE